MNNFQQYVNQVNLKSPAFDTDCFEDQYTDFGHTNLVTPKFKLKSIFWSY